MIDAAGAWRARRPVLGRRQLPRGAARARRGPRGARPECGLRVHMDIVALAADAGRARRRRCVLILPAMTRYESPGGITETSTERRIIFSPEIPGPRIEEARPEWRGARRAGGARAARARRPGAVSRAPRRSATRSRASCRSTRGSRTCAPRATRCSTAGPLLCDGWEFPTADGRARFSRPRIPEPIAPDGRLALSTRRGKQFNSMVQAAGDGLTGAQREAVLISAADARRLGIDDGRRGDRPLGRRRARRHRDRSRRSRPATSRSTGRRATC